MTMIVKRIGNVIVSFPSEEVMRRVLGEGEEAEKKEEEKKE